MKRTLWPIAAISFSLAALALIVHAQTLLQIQVLPDQGVGVLSEDPITGDRWSETVFPFGNYTGTVSGNAVFCRTYLRFPLGGLPANAFIQSATLYAYVDDYWPGPGGAPMSVYNVTAGWAPTSVDWYNPTAWPALGGAVATITVTSDGGWFAWDVTSLVQDWWSGTQSNYGLAVAAADLNSAATNWAAARRLTADDPNTRPYLQIDYVEIPPTPTFTPTSTPLPTDTPVPPTDTPQPQPPADTPPPPTAVPPTATPEPILLPETGQGLPRVMTWLLVIGGGLALLMGVIWIVPRRALR